MANTDGTLAVANQQSLGVSPEAADMLNTFWQRTAEEIKKMPPSEFKTHELPLARIKKIMKLDDDVKMISAEAPVLFAKAAEIFVSELSLRSWIHTEDNKRRTLQRNDISMAISKYDQFDFLIDIVPREELKTAPPKRVDDQSRSTFMVDQVNAYVQMAQQAASGITPSVTPGIQTAIQTATPTATQVQQVIQQQQAQLVQPGAIPQTVTLQSGQVVQQQAQQPFQIQTVQVPGNGQQQQIIQVQSVPQNVQTAVQGGTIQTPATTQVVQAGTQVYQQVVTPSGEIQNVPIQLTSSQLQALQLQIQGKQVGQQLVIQEDEGSVSAVDQSAQFTTQQNVLQQMPGGTTQVFIQEGEPETVTDATTT